MPSSRLAKLTRPRTDGLVSRPRLFSALDTACARPVVWIAGPPGAGNADPATFFYYLGMAAAELGGRKHKLLPLFTEEFAADLEGFARRFFRALYAQLPAEGVVVLDNYQDVPERALFHAVARIGAEELPEGVTLCSVSRIEPPGELVRLRASQRLSAIGWEDLKLTVEETAAIAADANPDASTLAVLREQSAGWAAGVVLMLERLRQTGGIRPGNTHENLETIFDYFAGQVFHAASRETQEMLLRMAFLPRLTAETAQVITGNPEAGRLLATLAKRNLFIDRRYGEQTTYQSHALFREFLKIQAREVLSVAELQRIAHSVGALLQTTGEIEAAFQLLFEQGAWENIAELIKAQAANLMRQGRRQTLQGLIESLPGTTLNGDPWLLFWLGVASASPSPSPGRDLLEEAYRGFEAMDDVVGMENAAIAEVDITYRSTGDMTRLDRWLGRFSALLTMRDAEPKGELDAKFLARHRLRSPDVHHETRRRPAGMAKLESIVPFCRRHILRRICSTIMTSARRHQGRLPSPRRRR